MQIALWHSKNGNKSAATHAAPRRRETFAIGISEGVIAEAINDDTLS